MTDRLDRIEAILEQTARSQQQFAESHQRDANIQVITRYRTSKRPK